MERQLRAAALAALLATVTLGACARGPRTVPPPPYDEALVDSRARELDALWPQARVDGLDDRRIPPERYWEILLPIVESDERFTVHEIGASVEGRPLRRVDFGHGGITVLLWSQMHGNESTASRALVDLFAWLRDNPDEPLVRAIEQRLAVTVVPMLNPDGAARFVRHNAVGIDINRDARQLATPEARALKDVRDEIGARWGFNLHDQNVRTRLGRSGRDVLVALLAPPPGWGITSPANEAAMQMCALVADALAPVVGDQVARYDESYNPRAFGDLMTSWGTSVVLIESGGEMADPDKERLRRANFVALLVALESIADGSWEAAPEQRYRSLPLNSPWIHDLLVRGASIVLPGREPVRADVAVDFADTLARTGGTVVEVGDLAEAASLELIDADGLYWIPDPATLSEQDGPHLEIGDPMTGVLARDPAGLDVVLRLRDGARVPGDHSTR